MIDFEALALKEKDNIEAFCKHYKLSLKLFEDIVEDYKDYLNLPLFQARKIANALGFKFSYLTFLVELEILKECFEEMKENWNEEMSLKFYPILPVYRYRTLLRRYCESFKPYSQNKDMTKALAVTAHAMAVYKVENRKRGMVKMSVRMRDDPAFEEIIQEAARTCDTFLRFIDEIISLPETGLNLVDLLETTFLLFQTIV